jgi:acyl transferase domain-containing protein/NADPH:quinone reductase-like Zn-dependent oxidoreductase
VLKAIMMLERGVIPPNANFEKPNPDIDTDFYNVRIPTKVVEWPEEGLRRISVNSFGFGGTNAHVVMDDAHHYLKLHSLAGISRTLSMPTDSNVDVDEGYATPSEDMPTTTEGYKLLVLSAGDERSLGRTRENLLQYYRQRVLGGTSSLSDLAYTLSTRRSDLLWRSYMVIDPASTGPETDIAISKPHRSSQQTGIAFVFTGQGAEYSKMGLELMQFPVFRGTMNSFDRMLTVLGCSWSLIDMLHGNENINEAQYSQPLCTALQIALVELLASFNIRPIALVGHSSGEIAAAYCAGAFSMGTACRIAYYRGLLASKLRETSTIKGGMISVNLTAKEVPQFIEQAFGDSDISPNLTVACVNSPKNVTISGDEAAIDVLKEALDQNKIFAMKLSTGIAYHSPAMEAIAAEYTDLIGTIEPHHIKKQTIPMISSLKGEPVAARTVSTASYWVQNLLSPVLFDSALSSLLDANNKMQLGACRRKPVYDLIEVGPHSALRRPCQDTLELHPRKAEVRYTSVLSKNMSAAKRVLDLVGTLFATGYPVCVTKANQRGRIPTEVSQCLVDLPGYPFDRQQTYWHESRISRDYRLRGEVPRGVLGARCADWTPLQPRWRKIINTREMPWVADHVVSGNVIYPGAGMLIMALEASRQSAVGAQPIQGFIVKEALFSNPMVLRHDGEAEGNVEAICQLKPIRKLNEKHANWSEVTISTVHDEVWTECFRCTIQLQYDDTHTEIDGGKEMALACENARREYDDALERCVTPLPSTSFYTYCAERGITYGPSFSILKNIQWNKDGTATGRVNVVQPFAEYEGIVHPAIVDAACQVCWLAPSKGLTENMPTEVPHKLTDMYVATSGWKDTHTSDVRICSTANFKEAGRGIEGSIVVLADDGSLLCKVGRLELSPIADDALPDGWNRQMLHGIHREPCLSLLTPAQMIDVVNTHKNSASVERVKTKSQTFCEALQLVIGETLSRLEELDIDHAQPHLQRYVAWLREVHETNRAYKPDADIDAVLNELESKHPEWAVHVAVARKLPQILRGDADPLHIIFSTDLAERFYVDMFQRHCDARFDRLLDLMSFERPGLKILEVGAGTGSMTSHVLTALQACEQRHGGVRFENYTYTDISHAFFEEAKERFKDHSNRMEFRVLDLEKDIVDQGYEQETYDLVIAGAVLHTTESLQTTLLNVRKCLKPGGKLMFFENVLPDLALQFSFGTLSGWWRGKEDWRIGPRDQYTSEVRWQQLLKECGFSGNDVVLSEDDSKTFSIIMSTAIADPKQSVDTGRVLMCLDSTSDEQRDFGRAIEKSLISHGRYACDTFDLKDVSGKSISPYDRVIVLCELGCSRLQSLTEVEFRNLQSLIKKAKNILWLTETIAEDEQSMFVGMSTGFLRTMRSEATNSRIVTLALQRLLDSTSNGIISGIDHVVAVFKRSFEESCIEAEYFVESDKILIGRLRKEISTNTRMVNAMYPRLTSGRWGEGPALKFDVGIRGTLDTLRFIEDPVYYEELGPNEVEVDARAWGLNFRDVFIALGRMDENEFGLDTAGYVTRVGSNCTDFKAGDRVVLACCGSFRMYPRADERLVIKIPATMSFEDAASLPAPAVTAHYCLIDIARLQRGERVLIHSAAGATGQLAVQLAKKLGAEVFATVSSNEKRHMLTTVYGIPDDHIFYSRNTTFAQGILRMTERQGVDVILNSLAGEALQASWECIAPFGRFVEIGKADIKAGSSLPMAKFEQNVSFFAVDLRQILAVRKNVTQKLIAAIMRLFEAGEISCPHPRHLYPVSAMEDAFRYLQSGKNIGRIVINNTPDEIVPKFLAARPVWAFDPQASYMIAGGLGGIGRAICRWMARRGVKNLILPSRSGPKEKAALGLVKELTTEGVNIVAPVCDVASVESLSRLLVDCGASMPPIKGCINAAMVLQVSHPY